MHDVSRLFGMYAAAAADTKAEPVFDPFGFNLSASAAPDKKTAPAACVTAESAKAKSDDQPENTNFNSFNFWKPQHAALDLDDDDASKS